MTMPSRDVDVVICSSRDRDLRPDAEESPPVALLDRALLRDSLRRAIAGASRESRAVGILSIGLRGFDEVARRCGRDFVENALKLIGERLLATVRRTDTVVRLDDSEFIIVQVRIEGARGCYSLARRLTRAIQVPLQVDGQQLSPLIDVGIVVVETDDEDPECWLQQARAVLREARTDDPGSYRCANPELDAQLQMRLRLERELCQALAGEQLVLHYQPIVKLVSRHVAGFEALLRWQHPTRGLLMPHDFLQVAEDSGLIVQLGSWVLHQACHDAVSWPRMAKVATNVSLVEFRHSCFADTVRNALLSTGLDPSRLVIEIGEETLSRLNERALPTLHSLKSLGVGIVMDDFGMGRSSLNQLQAFPFTGVKIDHSLMARAESQESAAAFVRAVISIGRSFGLKVTAEGVETERQLRFLNKEGCEQVQGYYFSRPMPSREIDRLITLIELQSQQRHQAE
ncbi:MAG TPA: GGDEF domain-containing phosphodiesterase [Geminicoccaceae bacterium]|nr:GGDEF domain-containing phosphodiesterase [Geminicoccaceae bacterium]